jgi:type 1 glutamine amidotransferase
MSKFLSGLAIVEIRRLWRSALITSAIVSLTSVGTAAAPIKEIMLIAGAPSHGPGQHEHRAGCLLLKSCLDQVPGLHATVYTNGWPQDDGVLKNAATVVLYMDGGEGHPALQKDRLDKLDQLVKSGTGLVCLHYATEPTLEKGEKEFLEWIGGAFEINWSVNPHWEANFATLPKHPITRGVQPFRCIDEWYFHLRFPKGMKDTTPILTAVPPESTMSRPDGPHEGNAAVRHAVTNREPQTVAWAHEAPRLGRGFGFTGGHFHRNWGDENFRKVVLNAIAWTAHYEIPRDGIESQVTSEQLTANLDPKGRNK